MAVLVQIDAQAGVVAPHSASFVHPVVPDVCDEALALVVPHAMNSATSRSPAARVWPVPQAPARWPAVPEVTLVVCVGVAGAPTAVMAIYGPPSAYCGVAQDP